LLVGLSLPAAAVAAAPDAGDDPAKEAARGNWCSRLFGADDKPAHEPVGQKLSSADKTEVKKSLELMKPGPAAAGAADLAREMANLLRRQAVCDQLRQIAIETRDEALLRQAEQLDQRAWATYSQRTGDLPGATARSSSDQETPAKHAGTVTASRGGRPDSPAQANSGKDGGGRAAREE
jgi:hypothetical protein